MTTLPSPDDAPRARASCWCFAALVLSACGGDPDAGGVGESSSSDSADTSSGTSSVPPITTTTTATTTVGETTDVDTGVDSSTDSSESSTGEPTAQCGEMPELPPDQPGTPVRLESWPGTYIDDLAVDAAHRRILAARRDGAVVIGSETFERVTDEFSAESFVATIDVDGEAAWLVPFHGAGARVVLEVATSSDDAVVVTGWFDAELAVSGTSYRTVTGYGRDGFVAKLDAETGALLWLRTVEAPSDARISAGHLVATEDGGALVVLELGEGSWSFEGGAAPTAIDTVGGVAFVRVDGDGELVWVTLAEQTPASFGVYSAGATRTTTGFGAALYSDAAIEIAGEIFDYPMVASDGHVLRLDDDGAVVRDDVFPFGEFVDIGLAPCDDLIVAGDSQGGFAGLDFGAYVTRVTADGELRWTTLLSAGQFVEVSELALDSAGQAAVMHMYEGEPERHGIAKLDGDGNLLWRRDLQTEYVGQRDLTVDDLKAVIVAGGAVASVAVEGLPTQDGDGMFLLELTP